MNLPSIHTPVMRVEWPGRSPLWVKDEGRCPTGTFKDRLAWRLAELLEGEDAGPDLLITCITLGNTALSLVTAFNAGLTPARRPQLLGVFPAGFSARRIGPDNHGRSMRGESLLARLEAEGMRCIEYPLDDAYLSASDIANLARGHGLNFARHRDISYGIGVPSYQSIAQEALADLPDPADVLVLPVGAGVLFEETVQYVERCGLPTRVVGATTLQSASIADKIYARYSPYFETLLHAGVASHPCYRSHFVKVVSDDAIVGALRLMPSDLAVEPSAAAAFSLVSDPEVVPHEASVLVVNTGNGII